MTANGQFNLAQGQQFWYRWNACLRLPISDIASFPSYRDVLVKLSLLTWVPLFNSLFEVHVWILDGEIGTENYNYLDILNRYRRECESPSVTDTRTEMGTDYNGKRVRLTTCAKNWTVKPTCRLCHFSGFFVTPAFCRHYTGKTRPHKTAASN